MKDKTEQILESLTPRGARAELRDVVLDAVAEELATPGLSPARRARWDLRIGAAVAVSLILGVVLNVWAIRSDDARQARIYGPSRLPRDVLDTVETAQSVAGPECAKLVQQRLVSAWEARRRDDPLAIFRYRQQLLQLVLTEKGFTDAKEDPQVDGHHSGQPDRSALGRQRRVCLA
jgi:hypothetical protein